MFDLLLSLEKLTVQIILFTCSNGHLVLNIAEIQYLFFQLLAEGNQLFSLMIEFALHVV
jgi:hypothetical protein